MDATLIGGVVSAASVGAVYITIAARYIKHGNGYSTAAVLLVLSGLSMLYAAAVYVAVLLCVLPLQDYPRIIRFIDPYIAWMPALTILWLLNECEPMRRAHGLHRHSEPDRERGRVAGSHS